MMQMTTLCYCGIILVAATTTTAFSPLPQQHGTSRFHPTLLLWNQPNGDSEGDAQNSSQEARLEQLAKIGAARVAKMDIPERAKRAMLAEAIEDSIFQYEIELEELIGESGIIPTDPQLREQCQSIAMQIKASQDQYEALVSGLPSPLLNTLDSLGGSN
jgi:hypothetical protein